MDSAPRFSFVGRSGVAVALIIVAALTIAALALHNDGAGAKLSLSIAFGGLFGFILQRSRFCFFCMFHDWMTDRDSRGLYGLLLALAVGIAGYTIVFGAWLPAPFSDRLPPDAFIGPVSFLLAMAGLAFGVGMAVSGSCVSAHLYRLGEGSPTAPFALLGTAIGLVLGFLTWNTLYTSFVVSAPVVWLPGYFGYTGALVVGLLWLGLLFLFLRRFERGSSKPARRAETIYESVFVERWPAWIGGLAIGGLATAAYLRVAPLGVTAEIGARSRQLADSFGWVPSRLEGLDTLRGCVIAAGDVLLTPNGAFVLSMVLASFASALASGQFKPERPKPRQIIRGVLGGILLGWGAMTGLGCTVGTLLSGIMAGALSGWIFGIAVFAGAAAWMKTGALWRRLTTHSTEAAKPSEPTPPRL